MTSPKPHYLLFCDGNVPANGDSAGSQRGRWRFVLEDLVSGERVEATDQEIACAPDRSALVAVLRGLEALEQPSKVTLVTTSRYVTRGLQYGLSEWRENDYSWEHFGAVQPIRNADIWRRIDRALAYHQVQCRWMAAETSSESAQESADDAAESSTKSSTLAAAQSSHNNSNTPEASVSGRTQVLQLESPDGLRHSDDAAPISHGPNAHRPNLHRPSRTRDSHRTSVSTSNYQRVYVDTPVPAHAASPSNPIAAQDNLQCESQRKPQSVSHQGDLFSQSTSLNQNIFIQNNLPKRTSGIPQRFFSGTLAFLAPIARPLGRVFRGPIRRCRHAWDMILTVDEWLESYLRCFLLLDPTKRQTRR